MILFQYGEKIVAGFRQGEFLHGRVIFGYHDEVVDHVHVVLFGPRGGDDQRDERNVGVVDNEVFFRQAHADRQVLDVVGAPDINGKAVSEHGAALEGIAFHHFLYVGFGQFQRLDLEDLVDHQADRLIAGMDGAFQVDEIGFQKIDDLHFSSRKPCRAPVSDVF